MPPKTFLRWGVDFFEKIIYPFLMRQTYTYPKLTIQGPHESLKRFITNEYSEFKDENEYIRVITCDSRRVQELIDFERRRFQIQGYLDSYIGRIDKQYVMSVYGNCAVCKCEHPLCGPPYNEEIKTIARSYNKIEFALVNNPNINQLTNQWNGYLGLSYHDLKIEFQVHTSCSPLHRLKKSQVIWNHGCMEDDDDYNLEKDMEDLLFEMSFFN
jgi:hypothetical protein